MGALALIVCLLLSLAIFALSRLCAILLLKNIEINEQIINYTNSIQIRNNYSEKCATVIFTLARIEAVTSFNITKYTSDIVKERRKIKRLENQRTYSLREKNFFKNRILFLHDTINGIRYDTTFWAEEVYNYNMKLSVFYEEIQHLKLEYNAAERKLAELSRALLITLDMMESSSKGPKEEKLRTTIK